MPSPYRASGPLPEATREPTRARLGLAIGAAGALACFGSLLHAYFGAFTAASSTVLALGAAVVSVGLVYASLDAPSGRALIIPSAVVFAATFIMRPMGSADPGLFMRTWVWPPRYFAVTGMAVGLLLRLRRSRPGAYGALLRLAAIVGAWWGLSWLATLVWSGADRSAGAEAMSRVCALGMLDMRRYLGIAPLEAPACTPDDLAREMATTRICLSALSLAVTCAAPTAPWSSRWAVLATAETVGAASLFLLHARWLLRTGHVVAAALSMLTSVLAVWTAVLAFDAHTGALPALAITCFAVAALVVDASIAHHVRPPSVTDVREAKPAFMLACGAIGLRMLALAVALRR